MKNWDNSECQSSELNCKSHEVLTVIAVIVIWLFIIPARNDTPDCTQHRKGVGNLATSFRKRFRLLVVPWYGEILNRFQCFSLSLSLLKENKQQSIDLFLNELI